jgi:hypothetical protein
MFKNFPLKTIYENNPFPNNHPHACNFGIRLYKPDNKPAPAKPDRQ